MADPEEYAGFYTREQLGFDIELVYQGFLQYKQYFKGQNCLELGPATGYMTKHLVEHFDSVVAVEGSRTLYEAIPEYKNLEKYNCLFQYFQTERQFDTIILNHVLEHIQHPVELLHSIKKWLHDDGVFIIGVPNAKSFHRLAAVKMGLLKSEYELNNRDKDLGHFRIYDFDSLINDVQSAGYEIIKTGGIFLKFLSNNQIQTHLSNDIIHAYFQLGEQFKENSAEIYVVVRKK